MVSLLITREKALELLKKWPQTEPDFNHYLESEAIMKELALLTSVKISNTGACSGFCMM